jgi:hypothetical protein
MAYKDGVNEMEAAPDDGIATIFVGAAGIGLNNTGTDGIDTGDVPDAFVAIIVNVYVVPFVNPLTTMGLDVPVVVIPPGLEVIVYTSVYKDGVNETDAEPEEGAAIRFVGAAGIGLTNIDADVIEGDVLDVLLPVSVKV